MTRRCTCRCRHSTRSLIASSATSPAGMPDSPSDWIRVLVDSYHDRRTAYEFAVNPLGVKQDRYW